MKNLTEGLSTPDGAGRVESVVLLLALIFMADAGENIEHFPQTVDQTQDDGHYDRYHADGEYQTFQ